MSDAQNAIFHDRDGKEYDALIQNEKEHHIENLNGKPCVRTIGLLRVNFGPIDGWKDVEAIKKDQMGLHNKRWYEEAVAAPEVEEEAETDPEAEPEKPKRGRPKKASKQEGTE